MGSYKYRNMVLLYYSLIQLFVICVFTRPKAIKNRDMILFTIASQCPDFCLEHSGCSENE